MVLKADFQTILQAFIYSNLPILMNPINSLNVIVTTSTITAIPGISTTNLSTTFPILVISPEVLQALQSYTLNNFPDIGLPQDIQQVAKNFISILPPLIPINSTTAIPVTAITTTSSS